MKINNDNFAYSILLTINEGKSKGSGFRLKYKGYNLLVSAKHVFFDDKNELYGDLLIANCPSPLDDGKVVLQINLLDAKIFYSKTADVCIILLGKNKDLKTNNPPLKKDKSKHKRPAELVLEDYIYVIEQTASRITSVDIEATRNLDKIGIANDVYLMGYPTSLGIRQSKYFDAYKPLIRKGIVSGINKNENTFIIDCPSYQGNSGGPIVEHGEDGYFRVIGLVSHYIPYETTWYNNRERIQHVDISNSGFSVCVPFDKITELIETNINSL
ncbi:S1 family peptidase [Pontibacter oryzae]|uniref:Serine protease n=1 Tax=Pontibacter oryzae TaxID=2304593 RepID=A0A399SEG6_9BACT|nr:serine protease [Pontibacter oryzae]RIJ42486.1 serine protease [Pontibacter oryzae]